MLFSVLMANYNNARFLRSSIRSLSEQTYTNWELIIVDDGSVDNFEEVMSEWMHDARIRIYKNNVNLGTATTKALCAEYANGSLAGYLDPDDSLDPRALEIMVNAHQALPGCSIVHSTNFVCDSELSVTRISECPKPLPGNTPYLLVGDGSIHHFVSFKVADYRRTPGLEKTREHDRASDQELYYLLEEVGDVHFINQPLHYYRIHTGSISNMGNEATTLNQHYVIIQKACQRRIDRLRTDGTPQAKYWIRQYQLRYRKIRAIYNFRQHKWVGFLTNIFVYSVSGGFGHLRKYLLKLPAEGIGLISRSLTENYNAIK